MTNISQNGRAAPAPPHTPDFICVYTEKSHIVDLTIFVSDTGSTTPLIAGEITVPKRVQKSRYGRIRETVFRDACLGLETNDDQILHARMLLTEFLQVPVSGFGGGASL